MSETKINASQTTITAEDIGASSAFDTMPTAAIGYLDKIVQYVGTTDVTYTNGYFYKCVSDGQSTPTYSWTAVQVQAGGGGSLPSQTGNAGKFLTTDGTGASWSDKPVVNNSTDSTSVSIISSNHSSSYSVLIGYNAGTDYSTDPNVVCIGSLALTGRNSIALGAYARARGVSTIQLNTSGSSATNDDVGTMKVANANGNYEIMSADGTIPADRLAHAINKYSTMPTAASTNEGWIVQFTGTTDSTYTHGHLYECVSDGADPATYSWTEVQLGGGGSSYTAGTGIDITNDVISVETPVVASSTGLTIVPGDTTPMQNGVSVGVRASTSIAGTAVGYKASADYYAVAIGYTAEAPYGGISLGDCTGVSGEFHIGLPRLNETTYRPEVKTYKLFGFDGLIPADRIAPTTGLADGNYRLRLVMASGVATLSWVAE